MLPRLCWRLLRKTHGLHPARSGGSRLLHTQFRGTAPHVVIADPARFEEKLRALKSDGPSRLELIVDFDGTLTHYYNDDCVASTTYDMIHEGGVFPARLQEAIAALVPKYYPVDPFLTEEQRLAVEVAWYAEAHQLILSEAPTRAKLAQCARLSSTRLRRGVPEMLHALYQMGVPVDIISAGFGDMILAFLEDRDVLLPNLRVVSNFMAFNHRGVATKFLGNAPVTILSKAVARARQGRHRWEGYGRRTLAPSNVVLLGDNLTDLRMAPDALHGTVLSVGFLNAQVQCNLAKFCSGFDVVLLNDGDFGFVNSLLRHTMGRWPRIGSARESVQNCLSSYCAWLPAAPSTGESEEEQEAGASLG